MNLPISFEEVSYFGNEFRGDPIVTKDVLYYFPHTRVVAGRRSQELAGKDAVEIIGHLGNLVPILGVVPWMHTAADKSVKIAKFLRRKFRPTTNAPRIRRFNLWDGRESSESLQKKLDEFIAQSKKDSLSFDEESVPKPMRFEAGEMQNARFGSKFKFDAKYGNHDFKVNLIHRGLFRKALQEAGFLK